jgi:hypothetical protein
MGFSGSDGLLLDSKSLNTFLDTFNAYTGLSLDVNTIIGLVVCSVTDSDGNTYHFDFTQTRIFKVGAPILVASYQCNILGGA